MVYNLKSIDRLHVTDSSGQKLNISGGNVVLSIDGKPVDLSKLDISVTPVVQSRTRVRPDSGKAASEAAPVAGGPKRKVG